VVARPLTDWYVLGGGALGVRSADEPLRDRFVTVFGECAVEEWCLPPGPRVLCTVDIVEDAGLALIRFDDPEPLDVPRFVHRLFADRDFEILAEAGRWSIIGQPGASTSGGIALMASAAVAALDSEWRPLIGNLAFNRVLRLQRGVVFLHAAGADVGGRGLLLTGPKGSGKTTLGTALAARGHGFLGDELVGVELATRRMLPIRRALSFREGARAALVEAALAAERHPVVEQYPDGTPRRRAHAADLFPQAPAPSTDLEAIFVLRSIGRQVAVEPFEPEAFHAGLLAPLASSLWGAPEALRAVRLGALMAQSRCYFLDAGSPDETADSIVRTMEAECR
jgi:hypothetical protein